MAAVDCVRGFSICYGGLDLPRANRLDQQCALQGRRMGVADPDERKIALSRTYHH